MCDMTHSYVWLDCFIRVTCPIHTRHLCTWHVSRISFTHVMYIRGLIYIRHVYTWHVMYIRDTCHVYHLHTSCIYVYHLYTSFKYVTRHSYTWHVWHDWFIVCVCVTWLIHMHDQYHVSFICETWLIHAYGMPHSHVRHDPLDVTYLHVCPGSPTHTSDSRRAWHNSFFNAEILNRKLDLQFAVWCDYRADFWDLLSERQNVARWKTHRMSYLYRSFSAKEPYN